MKKLNTEEIARLREMFPGVELIPTEESTPENMAARAAARGRPLHPKGVFRFNSFEEADEFQARFERVTPVL
ncbi:MAG TPA: hypothetical protein VGO11_14140 [Chthoniobacteraceae bacterium]|jgi:hypothetical protein|nr:hypothetical protein [Chthoniobacteraceae bacterium]